MWSFVADCQRSQRVSVCETELYSRHISVKLRSSSRLSKAQRRFGESVGLHLHVHQVQTNAFVVDHFLARIGGVAVQGNFQHLTGFTGFQPVINVGPFGVRQRRFVSRIDLDLIVQRPDDYRLKIRRDARCTTRVFKLLVDRDTRFSVSHYAFLFI